MQKPFKVWKDIYAVGGSELSHPYDCCVYLIDAGDLILIDSGAGRSFQIIHIPGHTQGSIAIYVDMEKRILFGQDVHGPYCPEWGADPEQAKISLQKLIDLETDILCEGHFGIYQPAAEVKRYIEGHLHGLQEC